MDNTLIPEADDLMIELTDADGTSVRLEFLDLISYNGNDYAVLFPEDENDTEVVILRVEDGDDEHDIYSSVDDETVAVIYEIFKEKFKDDFHFVD